MRVMRRLRGHLAETVPPLRLPQGVARSLLQPMRVRRSPSKPPPSFTELARERLNDPNLYRSGEASRRTLNSRTVFGDPLFWKAIPKDPATVRAALEHWYPNIQKPENQLLLQKLKALGEQYVVLLLDPGIAARPQAFVAFARKWLAENPNGSPFQLRKAFGQALGPMEVFRAISLPRADVEKLKTLPRDTLRDVAWRRGFSVPRTLHQVDTRDNAARAVEAMFKGLMEGSTGEFGPYPPALIDLRIRNSASVAPVNSYSLYPEVARSVPSTIAPKTDEVILMTVQLPALAVITTTGLLEGYGLGRSANGSFRISDQGKVRTLRKNDPGVEVFTFMHQHARITNVEFVDRNSSSFESV